MNVNNEQFNDPKGQGMPPPYSDAPAGPLPTVVHPYPRIQPVGVAFQQTSGADVVPVIVGNRAMGPKPSTITCPSCRVEIVTRVEYINSSKTHLFALGLCIVFWPLVCLPYFLDSCRNADHYCPNCNAYIGSYNN
ncbi:unnamed protein product [Spodoptera exigua]|nr:unnamed protein product [Spodoptera exigua]